MRGIIIVGGIIVGLLVVAIALGTLWLNSYIRSDAFRTDIEARASQSLGGPVQVQSVNFDIFSGVKLQGVVAQIDASHVGGQGALKMQVEQVNCAYSWTDLLSLRLRLTGVTLDKPEIVLTKQPTAPLAPQQVPPPANPATTAPSGPITSTSGGSGKSMPFQFVLDGAKINNGAVSVQDATGASMVELRGINASANTAGYYEGRDVNGNLKVAEIALPSGMGISDFSTPFTYNAGAVQARPFDAAAFGDRLAGEYLLGNTGPSVLDLNGKGLDVAKLTAATMSNSSAKLNGSLDLNSKWRGIETGVFDGEGDAQMSNGKLEGVKILQEISAVLKIKELDSPVISKGQTHFVVQNQQVKFIGLQLVSVGFSITGDGTAGFDGSLNANLVLVLTRDTMGKMPKELTASFVQQQDGTGSIAFQVTGTTANPQTDLPTRLLMQNTQIKNVLNKALNKFFH